LVAPEDLAFFPSQKMPVYLIFILSVCLPLPGAASILDELAVISTDVEAGSTGGC